MRLFKLIISLVLICGALHADTIKCKNDSIVEGVIKSASKDSVILQLDYKVNMIAKANIVSYEFTNADVLLLTDNSIIKCKVINKINQTVIYIDHIGVHEILNKQVKTVKYNSSDQMTVNELPATGLQFQNNPKESVIKGEFKKNTFFRASLGLHFAALEEWQEQFILKNRKHPNTSGFMPGGEFGVAFSKTFSLSVGYENFFGPSVKFNSPDFMDKTSASYKYLSFKLGKFSSPASNMYISGVFDLGLISGKEVIDDMDEVEIEAKQNKIAPRLRFGISYFSGNFEFITEFAYLFAKLGSLKVLGQKIPNYSLDFNGITLHSGIAYHIEL